MAMQARDSAKRAWKRILDRRTAVVVVCFAAVMLLSPLKVGLSRVEEIRKTYPKHQATFRSQTDGSKDAVAALASQSGKFTGWAVALIAWVAGLTFASEGRSNLRRTHAVLLLAPSAGLLLVSIWAGVKFDARLSYLALNQALGTDKPLNDLLLTQRDYLLTALVPIAVAPVLLAWSLLADEVKDEDKANRNLRDRTV
jgi:hypothetical protein